METIVNLKKISGCIIMTNFCNLHCKYCYVNQNKNTVSKSYIDSFINGMRYHKMKKFISFFGGEPMLLQNLIFDIANENPDFDFGIITNGTIEINKYIKWPKNIKNITFSLEINKECYEKYRGTKQNFNNVLKNIKLIENLLPNSQIKLNISLNNYVINNPQLLIDFLEKYKKYDILLYFTKGFIDYNKYELFDFMQNLKKLDKKTYDDLLMINENNLSDFMFSCTYDDFVTLNHDGSIITCEKENKIICNVDKYDEWRKIYLEQAKNHRVFNEKCLNCVVPYSFCRISCANDLRNNVDIKESCECQQLLWGLRMLEKGEINDEDKIYDRSEM